jgi:hypothetical protein
MSLIAYDSARPWLIPSNPAAVFPYADGHYKWSNAEFPRARFRYITALGNPEADIIDIEPGCVWPPARAADWAHRRLELGRPDLTVYTDRDNLPEVRAVMTGFTWHLFLSTLDGSQPAEYDGLHVRAVQFTDRKGLYDMSVVFDEGWLNVPAK